MIVCVESVAATRKLPENVDLMVLDASGAACDDVDLEELPGYLADKEALVWCDIYSTEALAIAR